jgi:hypothetical protein
MTVEFIFSTLKDICQLGGRNPSRRISQGKKGIFAKA